MLGPLDVLRRVQTLLQFWACLQQDLVVVEGHGTLVGVAEVIQEDRVLELAANKAVVAAARTT